MKLLLNNIFKGLLVSLLVITLGGFLYINIAKPEEINLQLISSSVVNQLGTESKNIKENKEDKLNNENKTLVEDTKETEANEEETKEDTTDTSKNTEVTETTKEEVKEDAKQEVKEEVKEETPKVEENKQDNEVKEPEKVEETNPVLEAPKEEAPQNNQSNNKTPGTTTGPYAPNLAAVNALSVLETHVGKITAYGPDCYGCYGSLVARGEYVGDGRIYYNDPTYGTIRIVAGDPRLGLGAIVRIKGVSAEPIIAIMLDTGGDIGFDKPRKIFFDLLYESEKAAGEKFGSYNNATFEILKYGKK